MLSPTWMPTIAQPVAQQCIPLHTLYWELAGAVVDGPRPERLVGLPGLLGGCAAVSPSLSCEGSDGSA